MNLTKKQMIVAAIVIGAVAVWYFFIRKKKLESGYDENVMIFGNESGYGPDYGAYGSYGNETGYSTSAVAYGGTKAATAVGVLPVRPMPISVPIQTVGSNEGQKCNKDHQCSPGLGCVNGRCGKKGRNAMSVATGSIKSLTSPYYESGYERKKGPLDTSPTFPDQPSGRISCPTGFSWNGARCVKDLNTSTIANRTMISCPPGTMMSGGKCVPVGGGTNESNWWGSDWANAVTKDLNRWSKNK